MKYEQVYLCQENLNSTSLRIWLYLKLNTTTNLFSYYSFTLRIINLIEEHKIHLEDHFEKQISEYVQINSHQNESNIINIHHLSPGRYEICVNFLNKNIKNFYYRSSNSCLHIPWNVSEHGKAQPKLFIYVLFMVLIIILLVTIVFFIYSLHQCFKPRETPVPVIIESIDEDNDKTKQAKFLVNKHFVQNPSSLELLIRKRIHQRYSHRSPDLNEI